MSEMTASQRPDPHAIKDAADLVAALRQLRTWAGEPSLRRLTALAGQRNLPDGRTVDALPSSTLADNLGGRRLPRPPRRSFVTAFVTACLRARQCSDDVIAAEIQQWRQALRRIAAPEQQAPLPAEVADEAWRKAADTTPAAPEPVWPPEAPPATPVAHPVTPAGKPTPHLPRHRANDNHPAPPERTLRWTRLASSRRVKVYAAAIGLLVLVAGVASVVAVDSDDQRRQPQAAPVTADPSTSAASTALPPAPTTPPAPAGEPATQRRPEPSRSKPSRTPTAPTRGLPAAGWYLVQPSHTRSLGYCWGEGRERNGRTNRPLVVQRPCAQGIRTKLVPLGAGVYRLEWHSAQYGVGCISVDYGDSATRPGALLAPRSCGYGGNRFRLEPSGGGYRLRPVHSGLCIGSLYGARDTSTGAEAMQDRCTGGTDQRFFFR